MAVKSRGEMRCGWVGVWRWSDKRAGERESGKIRIKKERNGEKSKEERRKFGAERKDLESLSPALLEKPREERVERI
jgi:hypothetical protein